MSWQSSGKGVGWKLVGLMIVLSVSVPALAQSAGNASAKTNPAITYNADGHPNLSTLKGATYAQMVKLFGKYVDSADATNMSGQYDAYTFNVPHKPFPKPASASSASKDQHLTVKNAVHSFFKDLKHRMTPHKVKVKKVLISNWVCTVYFNGPNHTVNTGSCQAMPNNPIVPTYHVVNQK